MPFHLDRLDPRLDQILPADARPEKLTDGFQWAEGPVWSKALGALLFSDIPANTLYQWKEGEGLSVYLRPAAFFGPFPDDGVTGSNGLTFDAQGRLTLCQNGGRCVARLDEKNFTRRVLADRFEGKRLNSPNDLVFRSSGDLYFTDPPYGLPQGDRDPGKELPFNGLFRLRPDGTLSVEVRDMIRPNGLAFSPDEKILYVSQSEAEQALWKAFDVADDGSLGNGRVFHDATAALKAGKPGLPDGMKVDRQGNLFASGPGGLCIFASDGALLGRMEAGEPLTNCAFGNDGSTLYLTWKDALHRLRIKTSGNIP